MAGDSTVRRAVKAVLGRMVGKNGYRLVQGMAMAHDIRLGWYSEPELCLIPSVVRDGETAVDIGANFGMYSYHLSRAVGLHGKVYAFEPLEYTASVFRQVAKWLRFRNVELIVKGCGDHEGCVDLTVPIQSNGAVIAGIVHVSIRNDDRPGMLERLRYDRARQVPCEIVTVDDSIPETADVSLMKLDIEGAELSALRGACATIQRCCPIIICEINPWLLEGFGERVEDVLRFFAGRGYKHYWYRGGRLQMPSLEQAADQNWVFVHPSRRARVAQFL